MTLTLHWWMLPLAIIVVGVGCGAKVFNTPESGMFPMNPLVGVVTALAAIGLAVAVCIGHWLR